MLETSRGPYTVTSETFDSISAYWRDQRSPLSWDCLFVLPPWLKAWWRQFGTGLTPHLCAVRHDGEPIGIAPLVVQAACARLMGHTDVCDCLDVVVAPGRGPEFFTTLIGHLRRRGVTLLDLRVLRPDSTVLTELPHVASGLNCEVWCEPEDFTFELDLPDTWDGFLQILNPKQRHEIRRKLRRLHEAGSVNYRVVAEEEDVREQMETFLTLFALNREDKATFMTAQMTAFFRSLAAAMAQARILKLFFLELNGTLAAGVMCFDYKDTLYLYNNGYDRRFRALSVGLLSKIFSIQDSIQRGRKKYDFLKGTEAYKHRLGGKSVPLSRCRVKLR
ncbi:MAG: GNAT family N-acetyltransferase [Desulfobacterales bacterium]|nr:MAG: GNAT family N-acetyltransferase [Desulfobacterales bacterium]